jgi:glycosyltransferase involved in cell wall biosynthesis
MKVASFAPRPPARSGVTDYADTLLKALSRHGDVSIGSVDSRADLALYHIGNNFLHREIYHLALRQPGVVVLHDAVLNHFFLGALDRGAYIEEFVYNYGEWNRGLAEGLWRDRPRSAADPHYFQYPMLKRLVCCSRAVIVHNPAAARLVREHNLSTPVFEIPHFFQAPRRPDMVETLRFRSRLGIAPRILLAGVFGHLRESKRLPLILRSVQRVCDAGADVKLLVQGEFASSDLERACARFLYNHPKILRVGFLSENNFWKWAAITDICINLRCPTAAETSGVAIRMMGLGKAVVFSTGEETARVPEDACLRVDHGPAEEEMLAGYLRWLADDREAAIEIGRRAAAHIDREHRLERIAEEYWRVLTAIIAPSRD